MTDALKLRAKRERTKRKILRFLKNNVVPLVAFGAAVITSFFVPVDREYISYFDFRTLSCLFLTLLVVCALRNIKFFTIVARKLVKLSGNLRGLFVLLIVITFVGSMLIANDMALITFLPLGYFALSVSKQEKYMAYLFVLQNISANLGGMLTPFGNPQNLYLYSYFSIPTLEFTMIMLRPFLLAIGLLMLSTLFVKPVKLAINEDFGENLSRSRTLIYLLLFLISLLIVFRIIPYIFGLVLISLSMIFLDREAFLMVDYGLLLTFFFFFIFAGNMARIEAVNTFLSSLLEKDTLLVSTASCQFISNVPSAILLSRFTADYEALLLGVNIGGTGTLIASLASLITYSEYRILYPKDSRKYLLLFTVMNVFFLVVMVLAAKFLFL